VCSGYKAPSMIDPKLLDPKYALKQLEEEDEMKANAIKSIKAMFDMKKHRGGYNNDSLYQVKTFKDFVESNNPYQFLVETNKIVIKTEDCEKYLKVAKPPKEYELYFKDLQLLGKKEVQELIIWRNKIRVKTHFKVNVENKETAKETIEEPAKEKDALELMNEELKRIEAQKKKKIRKSSKKD
jgi:AdoMet-dependent rRNA methyltransferase SPB1